MKDQLKLMAIMAHPDDESLGIGGTLAKYAAEGVEVTLLTATRGERGWQRTDAPNPGLEALGQVRQAELYEASKILGLREVCFLDFIDGDLDAAAPAKAIQPIVAHLRRVRPQVVVTWSPDGGYGHPDHIATCQFATAAVLCAADPLYASGTGQPHRIDKLYYIALTQMRAELYAKAFGDEPFPVDGVDRHSAPIPDWEVTTRLDAYDYWQTVWQAAQCHRSQLDGLTKRFLDEELRMLWGLQTFYRVFSLVNGGRALENDLFEGLR